MIDVPAMLRALATEIENATGVTIPPVSTVDAGEVAVSPTGVQGRGKERGWPRPRPEDGEMILGYSTRCQRTTDPTTNKPYVPAGRYPWGRPIINNFAETMDRFIYPMDWFTQVELDAQKAVRDAQGNPDFSGGRPKPQPPPVETPL